MVKRICEISNRILRCASKGHTRLDFIKEVAAIFPEFCRAETVKLFLGDDDRLNLFSYHLPSSFFIETLKKYNFPFEYYEYNQVREKYVGQYTDRIERFFSRYIGSPDDKPSSYPLTPLVMEGNVCFYGLNLPVKYKSQYFIPFMFDNNNYAFLAILAEQKNAFTRADLNFFAKLPQVLADGFAHQFAQDALKERVKELTCLYQITQIANRPNYTIPQIMQEIVTILPAAMQYPNIANARIFIDNNTYQSNNFQESKIKLTADITSNYELRGTLDIFYVENKIPKFSKIFLPEEENLIETVSKQLALIIERKQVEVMNTKLQEQLRHADRLATIGQLSAGIAHEINEPLGTILGFAQLIEQEKNLPGDVAADVSRIINASLHGREVIRKLMLFSRQMPPKKGRIDINKIIEDGLYFLDSRCAKSGIELVRNLQPNLPLIDADPNQIHQVLVNLIVNAVHSMPDGGKIKIITKNNKDNSLSILVKDTGIGIPEDIQQKIFIPFFTTKDINQGTGLGLSVVHGIVTAHKGKIIIKSELEKGSTFEIKLPSVKKKNIKDTT